MNGFVGAAAIFAIGLTGLAIVPPAVDAGRLWLSERDEAAVVSYRLAALPAARYASAVDDALAETDSDLARSLQSLAASRDVAVAPDVTARIAAAVEDEEARMLADAWEGFLSGDTSTTAALAGSLGADFTGYGDLRDLYEQAQFYQSGGAVDELVIGLAAAGLALTAATVVSLGSATPAKAGVSVVKAARRMGRLSPALGRQLTRLAVEAIDRPALESLSAALRRLDPAAARAAAKAIVRPASVRAIGGLGGDVVTIGRHTGHRGMMQALASARSVDEVGQIARLSARFGARTRGALALIGGAALTFASVAVTAAGWLMTGLVWLVIAVLAVIRVSVWLFRIACAVSRPLWRLAFDGSSARRSTPATATPSGTQRS